MESPYFPSTSLLILECLKFGFRRSEVLVVKKIKSVLPVLWVVEMQCIGKSEDNVQGLGQVLNIQHNLAP